MSEPIDWSKPLETVPCGRNPVPVPCTLIGPGRVVINGPWIDVDDLDEGGHEWSVTEGGKFFSLAGYVRNRPALISVSDILEALKWYADLLCEFGTSNEGCGKFDSDICAGCKARAAILKATQSKLEDDSNV